MTDLHLVVFSHSTVKVLTCAGNSKSTTNVLSKLSKATRRRAFARLNLARDCPGCTKIDRCRSETIETKEKWEVAREACSKYCGSIQSGSLSKPALSVWEKASSSSKLFRVKVEFRRVAGAATPAFVCQAPLVAGAASVAATAAAPVEA